jgi:hypothetical protein
VSAVKVDVAVPFAAGVTDAGAKLQVTVAFTGEIAQVNPTAKLKLFNDVTVIVEVALFPAAVVADVGEAVKLKSLTVNA